MASDRLIWPARLHHIHLTSEDPAAMVGWYGVAMGLAAEPVDGGVTWMAGAERNLLIGPGAKGALAYAAFALADADHLDRMRRHAADGGVVVEASPSPLFDDRAFAVRDPDGNRIVFGLPPAPAAGADPLPARLQHVVIASTEAPRVVAFYAETLGFRRSDLVRADDGDVTACFLRSDPEHHSLAVFRAAERRLDHHCYESTCWNDIRDWGDHFFDHRIQVVWGAGRHGAGHNLFIFVRDPDGNNVEISAEIDDVPYDQEPGEWVHEEHTLNLWGSAWMRS